MLYGEIVAFCVRIIPTLTCIVWAKFRSLLALNCRYGEGELVLKSFEAQAEHLRYILLREV